jgi:hypothetical protein
MNEGLRVRLTDAQEVADTINGGKHWIFVFGRRALELELMDDLDAFIGVYPTFPSMVVPIPLTFVPKSALSKERLLGWLRSQTYITTADQYTEQTFDHQDLLILSADPNESLALLFQLQLLASHRP